MKNVIFFFVFFAFATALSAQTFNFQPATTSAATSMGDDAKSETLAAYSWLEDNNETTEINGNTYPVFRHNGNPVVMLKSKYVVYLATLASPGTITYNGTEYAAYPTPKGKYVIYLLSKSGGMYAKYITPTPAAQ